MSVTSFDMKENTRRSSLWLLSAFGGEPRQLTQCGEKDGEPRWSPDGRWIAFVAKRAGVGSEKGDEESQVYLIAPDGGEARRLTDIAHGRLRHQVVSRFAPHRVPLVGLARREGARTSSRSATRRSRTTRSRPTWSSIRPIASGITGSPTAACRTSSRGRRRHRQDPRPLRGHALRAARRADPGAHYYDISPDGREIAFAFDPAEDKRFDHERRSSRSTCASRKFRTLTRRSKLSHDVPRYSPDGRWIALLTQDLKKSPVDAPRLTLIDRKSGRLSVVSDALGPQHPCAARVERGLRERCSSSPRTMRASISFAGSSARARPEVVGAGRHRERFRRRRPARSSFVRNTMSTPPAVFWSGTQGARAPHRPLQRRA